MILTSNFEILTSIIDKKITSYEMFKNLLGTIASGIKRKFYLIRKKAIKKNL